LVNEVQMKNIGYSNAEGQIGCTHFTNNNKKQCFRNHSNMLKKHFLLFFLLLRWKTIALYLIFLWKQWNIVFRTLW